MTHRGTYGCGHIARNYQDAMADIKHAGLGKSVYLFVVWSFLLFVLFGCFFFCCLGGGVFFFFAVWAGAKKTKQQKKHGFRWLAVPNLA